MNPDGQVGTVAHRGKIHGVESGYVQDEKVVRLMTDVLADVITRTRGRMDAAAEPDPVTQDLIIGALKELEMQHWMFQAMI